MSLLNRTKYREFTLEVAKQIRPFSNFSRVSRAFEIRGEAMLRAWIVDQIRRHPSKGVTIK